MLIRYYLTSLTIAIILIAIGQRVWAILPMILMIIMSTGTVQQYHTSQSLQQFATDNIMLLSRILLIVGVNWMAYLGGYNIIISMILISLVTIGTYCISLAFRYDDGIMIGHQASLISFGGVLLLLMVALFQSPSLSQLQLYLGIGSMYVAVVGAIMSSYWIISYALHWTLPHHFRDETILLWSIIIPIGVLTTVFSDNLLWSCFSILFLYVLYAGGITWLRRYHYPIADQEQLTLDLILKGYKTSYIGQITRWGRVNDILNTIKAVRPPIRTIIEHIPDVVMIGAYCYLFVYLLQGGIMVSDFVIYCLTFVLYAAMGYIYQRSGNLLTIDTIAMSFIVGYLSIMICMVTIFSGDLVSGSTIAVVWIIANALIVTQYRSLNLDVYLTPRHVQRRVWANTFSAFVLVVIMIQLPIDGMMIVPIILIVSAILGITIAQSYSTLRSLKN